MTSPVSDEQWAAVRHLREGAPTTAARAAIILGVTERAVRERILNERWKSPNFNGADNYWRRGIPVKSILSEAVAKLKVHDASDDAKAIERILAGTPVTDEGVGDWPVDADACSDAPDGEVSTPEARLEQLGNLLSRQIGLFVKAAETSRGILRKDQIDALSAMLRLAERFEAKDSERDAQRREEDDESFARFAARVDQQIIRFARHYAERMVRAEVTFETALESAGALTFSVAP